MVPPNPLTAQVQSYERIGRDKASAASRRMVLNLLLGTASVLWTSAALAQGEPEKPMSSEEYSVKFHSLDADSSGGLSLGEFLAGGEEADRQRRRRWFYEWDTDVDHELSLEEFSARKPDARFAFQARDVDGDGRLTETEFLRPVAADTLRSARRDLHLFDLDGDGALTYAEFLTIPSVVSRDERGQINDPVVDLVEQQMSEIAAKWSEWDVGGDGGLDRDEFVASAIARPIPGLALSQWGDWDLDSDGRVSLHEGRLMLEIAYGVRRSDGQPLRTASGFVVDWMRFQRIDLNEDDQIDWKEFLTFHVDRDYTAEYARQRFAHVNADDDEVITFAEWSDVCTLDAVDDFLQLDTTLDGRLSGDELLSNLDSWYWRYRLAPFVIRGFDLDEDGFLTLDEYRLTPLANPVKRWEQRPRDTDHDGRLGPGEFRSKPSLELAALTAEYFRLLDVNEDGYLDQDEYLYDFRRSAAPRSAVFDRWDRDRNKSLTLEEVLRSYPPSGKENDVVFERKIARVEEAFHTADVDGDGILSLAEFESDAATGVLAPTETAARAQASFAAGSTANTGHGWGMWIVVALNVALIGAAAMYFFRR